MLVNKERKSIENTFSATGKPQNFACSSLTGRRAQTTTNRLPPSLHFTTLHSRYRSFVARSSATVCVRVCRSVGAAKNVLFIFVEQFVNPKFIGATPIFVLFESLCAFVARSMWHAIVEQCQQQFNIARPAHKLNSKALWMLQPKVCSEWWTAAAVCKKVKVFIKNSTSGTIKYFCGQR